MNIGNWFSHVFSKDNIEKEINRDSLEVEFADNLLYKLCMASNNKYPICAASFNVILEGLYRNRIEHNSSIGKIYNGTIDQDSKQDDAFETEFINYKKKNYYVRKIKIQNNGIEYFLPIKNEKFNNTESTMFKILDERNSVYSYIVLSSKNDDQPPIVADKDINTDYVDAIAEFYFIVTKERYFVEENQYLKAMLFMAIFDTKYKNECESNTILNKAQNLLTLCYSNKKSGYLRANNNKIENDSDLDAFLIHEAFIATYNKLSDDNKKIIDQILRRWMPKTD